MNYEVVIGLETHVELKTESKIFCSCGGHAAAKTPNDCVCPACSGMPGMLPVMNKRVVELAVLAGLMLNCEISRYTTFDKKNYYYPDLPCAYQVTQINHPICTNGCVQVKTSAGVRDIHIKQIHMEEDAGKLVHSGSYSYVDFNRTSVPLIEIVTQPDFRSAEEVITYLTNLKSMFRFSGISECEEGAMRCDVNISVREKGSQEFGVRTEIKNMSSFESIEKAINYEAQRHMDAIEYELEELVQETRRYDNASGKTFAMRNKETEADYRYFPDANLMPIIIDDEWIEEIKKNRPVEINDKVVEYSEAGISEKEIDMIIANQNISQLLDGVVALGCNAKDAASWILTDSVGLLRKEGKTIDELSISPEKLSAIIKMVDAGEINRVSGKKILTAVLKEDVDPVAYCKEKGFDNKIDMAVVDKVIDEAIQNNAQAVADYKNGKAKAIQSVFGACMRELKGIVEPAIIKEMLENKLK
ncbi:Asp-tRNA(Asn)/Glu-tRNA(Gln) amidotransferase subunit GatB [[Clostridium] scindens]|uniref:Asp-tRNA(Asn)/Glu-tRNA(Gln) amidotransferase subunit GatB n=1 Tax=Clostridium scindens (strain JCM 10418 / VPI 12708) TaxID=29347 RepID=UPI00156EFB6A|nr:Asp-tRNA(Asn)/Glu-tRNA(Gln) amidotransferase subunit GatB [[Clostridium] scindens]NSI89970.1 Asp-tRNA(Asn)/Glu-tRNA(Gln) amidotransferase subunit GatB [[Clostridium] scindens]NSJ04262.1 Asp-tRNA(Asn)/Glu-tRNA(Gln) amidotransferase subunit GatB [[Clostridium] scindens]